ncbi:cysteine--tRNA ligase [Brackiella oedipodis]|uniref:cysteine--tRNA ligase n=1 Tax=Brackiella oedipodis TaxID=124225 RepID=UPI00048D4D53|nr:cysteine--tRNA ligase [Brackiella oedipodis]
MQIYNSLTRSKEAFVPIQANQVRMYVCGMTVYDYCHLGHARMLVSFDVVQRWFKQKGYQVTYVRNITDIDDKIIRKAVSQHLPLQKVTDFYTAAMHADEKALAVEPPDHEPRATQHITAMIGLIKALEDKGLAYQSTNGDVHYAVRKFPNYGKLSGRSLDDMRAGERIAVTEDKRDPLDFVLWKAAKDEEPQDSKWQSPYGLGRPGWHLECSAMSKEILGMPIDIHGGGPDLKFPHHENEIAQSEGAYDEELAHVWMHCGPLMVNNDKMSKSLGNFLTIRQIVGIDCSSNQAEYRHNPREAEMLRFFIVRNHYRSPQNFTPENLNDAQVALDRLYQTLKIIGFEEVEPDWLSDFGSDFRHAMDDDFNTALAISVLFEMANHANRQKDIGIASQMRAYANVLGLLLQNPDDYFKTPSRYTKSASQVSQELTDTEIEALITQRLEAKKAKDFASADQIRQTLKEAGIELEDKAGGVTQWRRL